MCSYSSYIFYAHDSIGSKMRGGQWSFSSPNGICGGYLAQMSYYKQNR